MVIVSLYECRTVNTHGGTAMIQWFSERYQARYNSVCYFCILCILISFILE